MENENEKDDARNQAIAQGQSVCELVAALECDYERLEELRDSKTAWFSAGWNMPGEFDDADNAMEYIKDEAKRELEEDEELSEETRAEKIDAIDSWLSDKQDEFGAHSGKYFYFVAAIGERSEDDEELSELEEAAGECESEDEARERIQEDALELSVRSDWHAPGDEDDAKPSEFRILLCTGGPAVQIRGELSEHCEPSRAWLEFQDWGTSWRELHGDDAPSQDTLLTYARCFYFGE